MQFLRKKSSQPKRPLRQPRPAALRFVCLPPFFVVLPMMKFNLDTSRVAATVTATASVAVAVAVAAGARMTLPAKMEKRPTKANPFSWSFIACPAPSCRPVTLPACPQPRPVHATNSNSSFYICAFLHNHLKASTLLEYPINTSIYISLGQTSENLILISLTEGNKLFQISSIFSCQFLGTDLHS